MQKIRIRRNKLIKIEDIRTYPKELITFFENNIDTLINSFENNKVDLDSSVQLFEYVSKIINKEYLYAIHGSRIVNINSIIEYGVHVPSKSDYLIEEFVNNIRNELDENELKQIKEALYLETRENDISKKYNKIWFILGEVKHISLKNSFHMLETYGGELLRDVFKNIGREELYKSKIKEKGNTYAVEFKIKLNEIDELRKKDIVNRMIEKYIFNTRQDSQFIECYTMKDIPKEQIISVIPIEIY